MVKGLLSVKTNNKKVLKHIRQVVISTIFWVFLTSPSLASDLPIDQNSKNSLALFSLVLPFVKKKETGLTCWVMVNFCFACVQPEGLPPCRPLNCALCGFFLRHFLILMGGKGLTGK